jgi:hypothetical protein
MAIALALAACSSEDKDDEPASDARDDEEPGAAGTGGDGAAGTATGAAGTAAPTTAEDPINDLLGGLVALFGENVETDVVHTIEGGTYDVITKWIEDAPTFHLTMPADLSEVGEPLPLVVWANGGCLRSDFLWQKTMFDIWAADGYAILALTSLTGSDDNLGMLGSTTSADQRAMVDWVEAQNASGPYEGAFDLDRVVFAGNSCGGITSLEAASLDERAAAVFVLSGSSGMGSANLQVMENITVPVGYAVGGSEDIAGANASADFEAMAEGVPAMIAHRFEGDHFTVSSDMTITPDVGKIGLSFLNLALFGSQEAYDELTSDTVCAGCAEGHWSLQEKHLETLLE